MSYLFENPESAVIEAERRIEDAIQLGSVRLTLASLGLSKIPDRLLSVKQLCALELNHNPLTKLPDWIGELSKLQELYLWDNELTSLPSSFARLQELRVLYIVNSPDIYLPNDLGNLRKLQVLALAGLKLSVVPTWLARFENLKWLSLGRNDISIVPDFISALKELQELWLDHNHLQELPNEIASLTKLRALMTQGNHLARIGSRFQHLRTLRRFVVEDNPLLGIPPEISSDQEASKILDYYFRTRDEKKCLNEAKLILLGRGEVGKTCVVNRLVHDKFVKDTEMTRGIAITQWQVAIGKDIVRLHVWDFGGQEIQHAMHQFFLTERSFYLVVLNGRAGDEESDAEYWLKFVKTFGGSSPTVVVLNKFKVQRFEVNRRALQEKYPFIRAFVETDCKVKTNNGIPNLKREIESALAAMEHVHAHFPAGWFLIKEKLAETKEPFISFAEYRRICAKLGEKNTQAQERLAGFLNALGIALNFREDPRLSEETVLNPRWITEGVYQIITSKILADRQGELRLADLASILPKKEYPTRMHGFLIELMQKFELCFSYHYDPSEHRYLVPELLGKEEPALKEPFLADRCLNFRYDYRMMPEGLLPRFITRTHILSEGSERWRTGVVLYWDGCRALVKADKQERQILVRVQGEPEKQRRLLAVIRENFDHIHSDTKEFKPTEWVALEKHPNNWISYSKLVTFEQNRKPEFEEPVDSRLITVKVNDVLTKTDVPRARECDLLQTAEKRPLKLFISYAHEDERWRARLAPNLNLLQREGLVEVWCDLQIKAGDKWDDEIKEKLNEADIYLFLMSTDLLASSYVQDVELPIARLRHEKKMAWLVPVVVRACSWARYLGDIQGLPDGGRPLKKWSDKDQAFYSIEMGLRNTISEIRKRA